MDGKHISLFHTKGSTEYYSYKRFFTLVMLVLVDYDYKLMFFNVGCQGKISDGDFYNNTSLSNVIENKLLDLPPPRPLPFSEDPEWIHDHETKCLPFMIAANDTLPLKPQIMKPYSHRDLDDKKLLFNYRAARYRKVTEYAFRIFSSCDYQIA